MRRFLDNENINIARGLIPGTSGVHKFGAVPAMSQSQVGSVWDVNDTIYPWDATGSGIQVNVDAVNPADVGKSIVISGLDANYNPISETIVLAAQANNLSTNTFIRVNRAYVTDGNGNVGDINIQANTTTIARITAGLSQTLMAVYTVPAGYTGYLTKGVMTAQASADGTGNMFIRYFGQSSFRVGHSFEISGSGGLYDYEFTTPIAIPEKSDIDVRVTTRSNNGRYTAAFDFILVQN